MERKELLRSPEYWTSKAQLALYACAEDFMRERKMSRTGLAEYLGVTKGYVSQLLSGEANHKLSKFMELALSFGYIPVMDFMPIERVLELDRQNYEVSGWRKVEYRSSIKAKISKNIKYNINGYICQLNKEVA